MNDKLPSVDLRDVICLVGLLLLAGGLSWWWHPGAGLAALGFGLYLLGVLGR